MGDIFAAWTSPSGQSPKTIPLSRKLINAYIFEISRLTSNRLNKIALMQSDRKPGKHCTNPIYPFHRTRNVYKKWRTKRVWGYTSKGGTFYLCLLTGPKERCSIIVSDKRLNIAGAFPFDRLWRWVIIK